MEELSAREVWKSIHEKTRYGDLVREHCLRELNQAAHVCRYNWIELMDEAINLVQSEPATAHSGDQGMVCFTEKERYSILERLLAVRSWMAEQKESGAI